MESFENAVFLSTCRRTKTEVFEYYDVINYILLTLRTFVRNAIVLKTLASCLRVDGRKRRFSNTVRSWIMYYWHYACFVSDAFVFTLFSVFAWAGENDSNTLRVDAYFFRNGGQNSRFSKIHRYVWTRPKPIVFFLPFSFSSPSWLLNPLSPKSDQHQISPCDINAL